MKTVLSALMTVSLFVASSSASAAPEWYVGYSFIYKETDNLCAFMRFRSDAYSVEQADVLYSHLQDAFSTSAGAGATLAHTLPSSALAKGESGETKAAEFIGDGLNACLVGGKPVEGTLFISAFPCDYQDGAHMCIRLYVNTGDEDASAFGIDRGPAQLGGLFVTRAVWDASSALVYAGAARLPVAIESALNYAASGLKVLTD